MLAEIITIGDEILIGQTLDSNSAWIAKKLNETGIPVYQITSITDTREHIHEALDSSLKRAGLVLITGGLGPTKDDITKEALAEYFNTKLVFNQSSYDDIKIFIESRISEMNILNRKQAEIPENCIPIQNLHGTAPGMWFEKDGKIVVSMPGVPYEMKAMMQNTLIEKFRKHFKTDNIVHKNYLVQGIPEAILAEKLDNWENNLPDDIKLAYLPSPGIIKLRFTVRTKDAAKTDKMILEQVEKLKKIIPDNLVGYECEKIEEVIGKLLADKNLSVSTAESCTGGRIAHLITSISGSSKYFQGSVVAYHNDVKLNTLKVDIHNIIRYGSVSREVVEDMAKGVNEEFDTEFAIATSGIAGPTGGTEEKPVGTTWIAIAGPDRIVSEKFQFAGEREQIIDKASRTALNMLRVEILRLM